VAPSQRGKTPARFGRASRVNVAVGRAAFQQGFPFGLKGLFHLARRVAFEHPAQAVALVVEESEGGNRTRNAVEQFTLHRRRVGRKTRIQPPQFVLLPLEQAREKRHLPVFQRTLQLHVRKSVDLDEDQARPPVIGGRRQRQQPPHPLAAVPDGTPPP